VGRNDKAQGALLTGRVLERDSECLKARALATLPKIMVASARVDDIDEVRRKMQAIPDGTVTAGAKGEGDSAILAAAPAFLTATEFMSGSVDDGAMVMDLERSIEEIRDRVELAIGLFDVEEGGRDEEVADALTLVELRELSLRCEFLRDRGLLHRIGMHNLMKILEILQSAARASDDVLIEAHETLRDTKAQYLLKAVECIGVYFVILSAVDMPKEIFREEPIDRMIERAKQHLVRNVFVFYDAGLWNVHRVGVGNSGEKENDDSITAKPGSSTKKNKDGAAPVSAATTRKSFDGGGCKVADAVGVKIGVIFTHLTNLILRLTLPDSTVLQLTALAFLSFGIENLNFVHLKSVELVVSIFTQYTEHRGFVIDSILASLHKIPTENRDLRTYIVPYEQSTQIQVLIALLMKCLQSSVEFVDSSSDLTSAAVISDAVATATTIEARSFGSAFKWTNYFWKDLLTRWPKMKAADSDLNLRGVIDNALADMLACRNLPEWPVANKLILNLAAHLLGDLGLQSKDAKIREIAIDFLGKLASQLRADVKAREEDELWHNIPRMGELDYMDSSGSSLLERALLFAQQDNSRIQANIDATTKSTTLIKFDDASEEIFVMESVLMRYLAENNRSNFAQGRDEEAADDGVSDTYASSSTSKLRGAQVTLQTSAMTYHASQFARDAERAGVGFRLTATPGGTRAMYGLLHATMMRVAANSRKTHHGSLAGLSRALVKTLCLQLNAQRPLMQQLDRLVQRVVSMLDDSAVLVRTAATRAIGLMLDQDSRLLNSPELEQALKIRLKDTGTSVRCVVIDVLGRQLVRNITLADRYYDLIEDRISDVSVSVRKRVILVLHECLRHPEFIHVQKTMKVLAFRILDEDEGIRSHIVRIFREIWFSPVCREREDKYDNYNGDGKGALRCAHGDNEGAHVSMGMAFGKDSVARRARQIVDVAWDVYCLVSRSGKQKLPLLQTFPIVTILSQVLHPSEDEKLESWVNSASIAHISHRVAFQMLQALIESESNETVTAGSVVADPSNAVPWSIKYAIGLHILGMVDPCLCLPSQDPTYFAVALQPYLKRFDDDDPHICEKLQCYMSVIYVVAKHAGRLPKNIAREIEQDLRIILLRHHDKAVIHHTCKALCAVAETQGGKESGTISMLKRFVSIVIDSLAIKGPLNAQQRAYCARSLYVLGNIARFGADIIDAAVERNECEISIPDLLRVFRKTLEHQPENEYELTRCALGACGDLLVARPELMFNKDGGFGKGSFDAIMRAALSAGAERGLKEQSLLNLSELIREEECRMSLSNVSNDAIVANSVLRSAQKRARDSEKLQIVNGQSDRSIAGGIAQRYWMDILFLCVDPMYSVRLKGLHLVEIILRQGLVHPASAFPMLIALQIDPVPSVKRLARKLLKTLYDRYGEYFDHQLTQGVEHAYAFKKRLEMASRRNKDHGITKQVAKLSTAAEGFGFVYGMVNSTRTSRNMFLNSLLRRFETTTGASDVLFLRFLAGVVAELPFSTVDEALYVVFQLNRVISLKGGLLLEKLTAAIERAESKSHASDDDVPNAALKADVELACALMVVLLLKSHVKRAYDLSDARVLSYVPTEATRNAEILKFNENVKFESSIVNATAGETMGTAKRAIETFQELITQDASDYAEDMFKDSGTKQRGASRKSRCAAEDEDTPTVADHENDKDDEDEDNHIDDAYTPLESAGLIASKGKRKQQQISSVTRITDEPNSPKRKLRF